MFNNKILHNQLNCNYYVKKKWNKDVGKNCIICEQNENIEHLIHGCSETKRILEKVSGIFKLNITWKTIALCFLRVYRHNKSHIFRRVRNISI